VSAEQTAVTPTCAECGAVWLLADQDRWQAHFDCDDVLYFLCAEYARREVVDED
jgi:hypothetical protein